MQSRAASMTTLDKLAPSLTGRIRISTVICYASRSNCGRENPSPSVRCAGNICCLLVVVCAFVGSVDRENQPVKHRCRCRVNWARVFANPHVLPQHVHTEIEA